MTLLACSFSACLVLMQAESKPVSPMQTMQIAVSHGDLEAVRRLVDGNPELAVSIDTSVWWSRPPIVVAASQGQAAIVRFLLDRGVALDMPFLEWTPLMWAAQSRQPGVVEVIDLLVNRGARLDAADGRGRTALHLACLSGREESALQLCARGASLKSQDKAGRTPLHAAAMSGYVDFFWNSNQWREMNAAAAIPDSYGWTPLHVAVADGQGATARILARFLASDLGESTTDNSGPVPVVRFQRKRSIGVDQATRSGKTALHLAAERADIEIIRDLLGANASLELADGRGWTAARFAERGDARSAASLLAVGPSSRSKGAAIVGRGPAKEWNGPPPFVSLDRFPYYGQGPRAGTEFASWSDGAVLFGNPQSASDPEIRVGQLEKTSAELLATEIEESGLLDLPAELAEAFAMVDAGWLELKCSIGGRSARMIWSESTRFFWSDDRRRPDFTEFLHAFRLTLRAIRRVEPEASRPVEGQGFRGLKAARRM